MRAEEKKGLGTKERSNEGRCRKGEGGEPKWNRMELKTLDSWVVIKQPLKTPTICGFEDGSQRQNQERESTTSSPSSPSALEKKQCEDTTTTSEVDFKNREGRVSNPRNSEDEKLTGICLSLYEEDCSEQKRGGVANDIAPFSSLSEKGQIKTFTLGSTVKDKSSCETIHKKSEDVTKSKGKIRLLDASGSFPSETPPSGGLSILGQIEKARRDALHKQNSMMKYLGIIQPSSLPSSGKKAAKRPRPPQVSAHQSVPQTPLRRSTRRVGGNQIGGRDILPSVTQSVQIVTDEVQLNTEHALEEFHDSSVLKYVVEPDQTWYRRSMIPTGWEERGIKGLRLLGGRGVNPLSTGALGAIYSMDLRVEEGLVTAGGKGGMLSVMSIIGQQEENMSETESDEGDDPNHLEPLLCFKGHGGWISGVKMLHPKGNSSSYQVVTTANDGFVKLWDVSKVCQGVPHLIQTLKPHKGGIFCMHALGLKLLTGGKDKVVTVSTFCNEGGIRVERGLDKLHTAIVKDVQWRDECCLASCGDDRTIQISDVREKEGGRVGLINNSHDCTVHTIRWHPVNNHTFVSAGLDRHIKLWDLRNISVPSKVLSGHVSPYVRKIRSIRHPEFYAEGRVVLTGGEGSGHLTLYNVDAGNTVSHGELRKSGDVLSLATSAHGTVAASVADNGIYLLGPELNS